MAAVFPHLAKQFVIGPWHEHQESLATLCTTPLLGPTLEERQEFLRRPEYDPYEGRELETAAMMSWAADNNFVLSLTLHDGSVGITYPFHQLYKHM